MASHCVIVSFLALVLAALTTPIPAAAQRGALEATVIGGSCQNPGAPITRLREFRQQETADPPVQTSFTTVDQPLASLAGSVAIAISTGDVLVACGDVPAGNGDDLYFALLPQRGSGHHGIGWLHARGNQTQASLFVYRVASGSLGGNDVPTPTPIPADPCAGAADWYDAVTKRLEEADRIVNLLTTTLPMVGLGSGPQLIEFGVTLGNVASDLRKSTAPPALIEARDTVIAALDALSERLTKAGERLNAFDPNYLDDLKKVPGLVSDFAAAQAQLQTAAKACGAGD